MKSTTIITAHSGCENTEPDSLASIETGIASGAGCIEVDVRPDGNGRLILSHDERSSYDGAVTLQEAFLRIAGTPTAINCDLKVPAVLYPVLDLAEHCQLSPKQLILSGNVSCELLTFDPQIAKRARVFLNVEQILKHLLFGQAKDPIALLYSPWEQLLPLCEELPLSRIREIADIALRLGAAALNMPFHGITPEHISAFRACGLPLSFWTVNEEADLVRFLAYEPANITTLQPKRALRLQNAAE